MLSSRTELNVISNHQVLYLRKCHDKTAPHAVHVGQKVAISLLRERLTHVHPSGVCAAGWEKRVKSPPAALPHPL